jgi:hypothetical protein
LLFLDQLRDALTALLAKKQVLQPSAWRDLGYELAAAPGLFRDRSDSVRAAVYFRRLGQSTSKNVVLLCTFFGDDCLSSTTDAALVATTARFDQGHEKVTPCHRTLPSHFR